MPNRAAQPDDWKTQPLPAGHSQIDLNRTFSLDELARIKHGLIPEVMEDKWFIYWQDDGLFFYRSWTGFCIYIVDFDVTNEGATMGGATYRIDAFYI